MKAKLKVVIKTKTSFCEVDLVPNRANTAFLWVIAGGIGDEDTAEKLKALKQSVARWAATVPKDVAEDQTRCIQISVAVSDKDRNGNQRVHLDVVTANTPPARSVACRSRSSATREDVLALCPQDVRRVFEDMLAIGEKVRPNTGGL